jgi:hypothetical protein
MDSIISKTDSNHAVREAAHEDGHRHLRYAPEPGTHSHSHGGLQCGSRFGGHAPLPCDIWEADDALRFAQAKHSAANVRVIFRKATVLGRLVDESAKQVSVPRLPRNARRA